MRAGQQPQPSHGDQPLGRFGQRAVAVDELCDNRVDGVEIGGGRQPAVGLQPQPVAVDVVRRQMRIDRQVDPDVFRLLRGGNGFPVRGGPVGFDCLTDQPHVQVEADPGDVPGLLGAQHVSGAADLEVLHRHRHAGAEFVVLGDGGQPVVGRLGQRHLGWIQEVRVAPLARAAHPPAQLM